MTAIELSRLYLETGIALGEVLSQIAELVAIRPNWLYDVKAALEFDNPLGNFTIRPKAIQTMQEHFVAGDYTKALFGLRQLDVMYYRKKYFFDDTKQSEEQLKIALSNALEVFLSHADAYLADKLKKYDEEKLRDFNQKLRSWSILKSRAVDATNEMSTLARRNGAKTIKPILLEICNAKELYLQAVYQRDSKKSKLSDEDKANLKAFLADFTAASLETWTV